MKHRSPAAVLLLPFVTFFIYPIYWYVSTKKEMNKLGATIPTAWLIIVPIVSIWWMWKYSEGVEKVTNEKTSGVLAFLLLWLLGFIGSAIIQDSFNKVGTAGEAVQAPPAPADPSTLAQMPPAEPTPVATPTSPTPAEQPTPTPPSMTPPTV